MLKKYPVAGVNINEIDQSNNLSVAGTSSGAIVVRASKGPVNKEVRVSDYVEYTKIFGNPLFKTNDVPVFGYGAYTAEQFLKESNELHVVRVCDSGDKYPSCRIKSGFDASSTWGSSADVTYDGLSSDMTPDDPDTDTRILGIDNGYNTGDFFLFGPLGPGTDGENIGITLETFNTSADFFYTMDDFPTNSAVANILTSATNGYYDTVSEINAALNSVSAGMDLTDVLPIAYKTVKVSVYVKKDSESWSTINAQLLAGQLTFDQLSPVETFTGTLGFNRDASGKQLRLKDQINGASEYIYVATGSADMPVQIIPETTLIMPFDGGTITEKDGTGDNDLTAVLEGWDFFSSKEYVTVNILCNPDWNTSVKQKVAQIAATRMGDIATGQSGKLSDNSVSKILLQEKYGYSNPNYMALYAGWGLITDGYNGRNIYIPLACFAGALMARVDRTGNTWDAPAGDPKGILPILGMNHVFSFTEIGQLNAQNINTSRWMKSSGHTIWASATAQIKDTSLSRIGVRRLLNYIENTVEATLLPYCHNIVNVEGNRFRISSQINGFLATTKGGLNPGVEDARAVCNANNNPAEIIAARQMVINLFVTPATTVENIVVNVIVTKSGVSFTESIV
jgi:hypothetical protein